MQIPLTAIALGLLLLSPQISAAAQSGQPDSSVVSAIQDLRAAKDSLLRHDPQTPLKPEALAQFSGLQYFPIDLDYRLQGALHIYGRTQQISVPTNAGTRDPIERYGRLFFHWQGKPFWLEVYRSAANGELLIIFTDTTNGHETYSAGRYLPLEEATNGMYVLDFNIAYNPYCAYNAEFICPMPPPQNALDFPVRAGERDYGAELAPQ